MFLQKYRNLLLSILSAVLLSLPWLVPFTSFLLLFAFVPMLLVEDRVAERRQSWGVFYYGLTFLLWNVFTTWWIYNATLGGAIVAFVGNAFQMYLVFSIFRWVKRYAGKRIGYATLLVTWLAWEWFYFDAEITWTWLTLGNGFARDIALVQWYELTGVLGGSLWVLIANFYILTLVQAKRNGMSLRQKRATIVGFMLWILVPVSYSMVRFLTYNEYSNPVNVLLLQPNIDPYGEKFKKISYDEQAQILTNMAAENADSTIDYIIGPETSLLGWHWEEGLSTHPHIKQMKEIVDCFPRANFVTGIESQRYYPQGTQSSPTSRPVSTSGEYFDAYNAAVVVNSLDSVNIYRKSKLVVGVEMLPYYSKLKLIRELSINLGGTSGTLGTQAERTVFRSADGRFNMGVAICFESIFGQYYGGYVLNGADIMAVITNDGWWGNTPGYKQHLSYSSLRAIETRRSIMRSGNTGISALINQKGEIVEQTPWWIRTTLKGTVNANSKLTFYTRHGDIIGRVAAFLFVLCVLYGLRARLTHKY